MRRLFPLGSKLPICSLQIHYDSTALPRTKLLSILADIEQGLPPVSEITVPTIAGA
ncbi:hypothetical protein [Rhizobium sp. RU20A]|uniref:hypothetical protein n=1 Tax=Rhizobium sp. RU20A TaxID=1907412 RepID=UPI00165F8CF7|nr:hypothetical protein [Rhizobium sp. RU20A]